MFLHIFLIPDSLILLKYWAPFIKIQEIRWPRPSERDGEKEKIMVFRKTQRRKNERGEKKQKTEGGSTLTFKDVLELVLLQGGPHDLLYC